MRVWAELAALFGRLPGSIKSLEKSPMQETKLISALLKKKKSYSESPPTQPPTALPPSLLPLPSPHPTKHSPSISYQIITWLWCIRLLDPGSASLLICLSLCLQQHHAKVGFAHNSSKVAMRAVAVMDPNDLWRQSVFSQMAKSIFYCENQTDPWMLLTGLLFSTVCFISAHMCYPASNDRLKMFIFAKYCSCKENMKKTVLCCRKSSWVISHC